MAKFFELLPLWLWAVFGVTAVCAGWWLLSNRSKSRRLEAQEALALQGDATHEGAQTRHEGGA